MSSENLTLRIPGTLKKALQKAAKAENRSVSNYVMQVFKAKFAEDPAVEGVKMGKRWP